MEVGGLVKLADGLKCGRVLRVKGEGIREVDFRDAETGCGEGLEGVVAVVELEGEVAGVVVNSDVLVEAVSAKTFLLTPCEKALKKGDGFGGVFEVP